MCVRVHPPRRSRESDLLKSLTGHRERRWRDTCIHLSDGKIRKGESAQCIEKIHVSSWFVEAMHYEAIVEQSKTFVTLHDL